MKPKNLVKIPETELETPLINPEIDPLIELMTKLLEKVSNQKPVISLRDYFAGLAMQTCFHGLTYYQIGEQENLITKLSYEIADALLKEKEKHDAV